MKYSTLTVNRQPGYTQHKGLLHLGPQSMNCILGRSGITVNKREGDGATPIGEFRILYGFYRKNRIVLPQTEIEMIPVNDTMGWCDDPSHPCYNTLVKLPFKASHETLVRDDRLYDICLVLDYNIAPRARNRGSAIFFHLTSPQHKPTEGCVALDPQYMLQILRMMGPDCVMRVKAD